VLAHDQDLLSRNHSNRHPSFFHPIQSKFHQRCLCRDIESLDQQRSCRFHPCSTRNLVSRLQNLQASIATHTFVSLAAQTSSTAFCWLTRQSGYSSRYTSRPSRSESNQRPSPCPKRKTNNGIKLAGVTVHLHSHMNSSCLCRPICYKTR